MTSRSLLTNNKGAIRVLDFGHADMKRYGRQWRFMMERRSSARMVLKGCTAYPFSADRPYRYGMDPRTCLDKQNAFQIEPVRAVIEGSSSGVITVAFNEYFYLGSQQVHAPESSFMIDEAGVHVIGWHSLKRGDFIKTWKPNGAPLEYEQKLAYPYAARISLKRGRKRDIIEFSLFYCSQPQGPRLPFYAPVQITAGDGKHIVMDYKHST